MTWATDRGTEIWDSFYKLLDETERSGADLLLIAGDLFHRQPLKRELKELNYRFSQLTHAKVVIVAGNHDYIGNQSFYKEESHILCLYSVTESDCIWNEL